MKLFERVKNKTTIPDVCSTLLTPSALLLATLRGPVLNMEEGEPLSVNHCTYVKIQCFFGAATWWDSDFSRRALRINPFPQIPAYARHLRTRFFSAVHLTMAHLDVALGGAPPSPLPTYLLEVAAEILRRRRPAPRDSSTSDDAFYSTLSTSVAEISSPPTPMMSKTKCG